MGKIKKITVDRNLCIGVATCIMSANKVFEFDGENKATVIMKDGSKLSVADRDAIADGAITDDQILKAAQACPTKAIILEDENGTRIYP